MRRRLADEIERDGRYRTIDARDLPADHDGATDIVVIAVETENGELYPPLLRWPGHLPVVALVPFGTPPVERAAATLTRPLKLAALLEAIERVMSVPGQILIGPYRFEARAKLLIERVGLEETRSIRLTEKEVAILECLYRANRDVVPRERLLSEVWGYSSAVTTHTLETHVYRLRRKLETGPTTAGLLITEPGGYRLDP